MKGRRGIVKMLLAALLAPVLLLGLPWVGSAVASSTWILGTQTGTNVGGWELWDYAVPEPTCALRAKWSGYDGLGDPTATLAVEGKCEWVFTPHVSSVVFSGASGCTITMGVSSEETSSWWDASDETSFTGSLDTFTGCEVNEWTLSIPKSGMPDAEVYGTIPLGDASEPVVASGDCAVDVYELFSERRLSGDVWEYRHGFGILSDEPRTVEADYNFSIYNGQGGRNLDAHGGQTGPSLLEWDLDAGAQVVYTPWHSWGNGPFSPDPSAWSGPTGIYEAISDPTVSFGTPNVFSMWEQGSSSFANAYLGTGSDGLAPDVPPSGATAQIAQGMCSWWITEEGSVTPSDGPGDPPLAEDEPLPEDLGSAGDGNDEPATEAGCSFSLTDPTTWATAGICALVYLMKKAVALLKKILAALANGAGLAWDGLTALWVPDQDHWQDSVAGVRQAFDDSGPGEWGGAVSDTVTAVGGLDDAAGGCDGPTLSGEVAGVGYDLDPLDSCDAPMSTVANMVKVLLTLFVAVGGILACAQPLAGALGLNFRTPEEKA